MGKSVNVLCLVLWIFQLIYAVVAVVLKLDIHPAIYLCSVAVCVVHYLNELTG